MRYIIGVGVLNVSILLNDKNIFYSVVKKPTNPLREMWAFVNLVFNAVN